MSSSKFSKKEAFQFGWNTMEAYFSLFVGIGVIAFIVPAIFSIPGRMMRKEALLIYIFLSIIAEILRSIIHLGIIKITIRFTDNIKSKLSDLFSCYPLFFKYLFGLILFGLIITGGLILLIIPGVIWAIRYGFFSYFIVDKGMGPIEALKSSSSITKGETWNLFLFILLTIGINLLGALALIVGLFATVPTTIVATAFVYRKLVAQAESIENVSEGVAGSGRNTK